MTSPAKLNEYNQAEEPAPVAGAAGLALPVDARSRIIRARLSNHADAFGGQRKGMVMNQPLVTLEGTGIAERSICRLLGRTP